MNFNNKVVLITGSSRGIGKAIAIKFASLGATVFINGSKDSESLESAYDEILALGGNVYMYLCDVSSYESTKSLFEYIYTQTGHGVDILINNAGISYVGLFTDTTPDMWTSILNTNLSSIYNCCHLAVPSMIKKQSGCIINISSIWGNVGASCEVAYSATKGGINSFSKSLGKELGPCNIKVNAIACGFIDTGMNSYLSQAEQDDFINEIPLCRAGKSEEVADLCVYLASDHSSYLTAQVITLDGGVL
ncbi:MAG TPA: SDR family oxidoreductase [Epulopiscium sp.]|nr:SDR family oxidoreductase [Candidatus Epulonipiscium sp.]